MTYKGEHFQVAIFRTFDLLPIAQDSRCQYACRTSTVRSQRTLCSVSSPALCQKQAFLLRNHYVLITGGQVVFYEVYAFSECQLNANVMTGKRVTDVAVNHQRWRVICRRSVYCSKPDRISRADGATNVGRYVRKCTSYWSMDMACRNGE